MRGPKQTMPDQNLPKVPKGLTFPQPILKGMLKHMRGYLHQGAELVERPLLELGQDFID